MAVNSADMFVMSDLRSMGTVYLVDCKKQRLPRTCENLKVFFQTFMLQSSCRLFTWILLILEIKYELLVETLIQLESLDLK